MDRQYRVLNVYDLGNDNRVIVTNEPPPEGRPWKGNKYTLYIKGYAKYAVWATNPYRARGVFIQKINTKTHLKRLIRCVDYVQALRDKCRIHLNMSKDDISKNLVLLKKFVERQASEQSAIWHFERVYLIIIEKFNRKIKSPNKNNTQKICARYLDLLTKELYERKGVEWLENELIFEQEKHDTEEDIFKELSEALQAPQ